MSDFFLKSFGNFETGIFSMLKESYVFSYKVELFLLTIYFFVELQTSI